MRPLRALEVPLHGLRLIEASAGTGKTFTITTLVLRLLLERALRIDQILVVTFTIAATAELRERIRARIRQALGSLETHLPTGDPALDALLDARRLEGHGAADAQRLREALSSFDLAPISTIHGFCRRTLQGHAFESGVRFDRKLITDSSEFLESVTRDFLGLHLYDAPEAIAQDLWEALRKTNLRDLVRKVSANPLLRILPDREIARSELLAASADLEARFQAAAGSWASARDAIETLLCEGGSLNGNSYRPSTIRQRWLPELDAYFGGGRPSDAPESLLKLTPATLLLRVNKGKRPPEHPFFELAAPLHEAVSLFLSLLREAALTLRLELVRYAREELPRRKAEAHVLSFDDLLQQLARALEGPGGPALGAKIRASYGAAMIDEFQDTDPIQYSIFERIYAAPEGDPSGGAALFQIGDPKQAIYAFRGADIFAYLEAKRRASGGGEGAGRAYTLDRNWRSDPSLLRALAEIFGRARDPFFFPQIEFVSVRPRPGARDRLGGSLEDQPALELLLPEPVPDEEPSDPGAKGKRRARSASLPKARPGISRLVAGEIAALLGGEATIDGRPIEPGDIAVLCKAHRELAEMRDELSRFGIPSVLRSRESIFESAEATDLCSLLQALVSPSDRGAILGALASGLFALSARELDALRDDEAGWDRWGASFRRWHREGIERGFVQMSRTLFEEERVIERLLALPSGERRTTNLLHLVELVHASCSEARGGVVHAAAWLARMCSDPSAREVLGSEDAELRLESDARAVQLVTIHASKGLEYGVVYLPHAYALGTARRREGDALFHDPDASYAPSLDLGSDAQNTHASLQAEEEFAESLRQLYVALTRARHRLSLVWGCVKGAESSALGYLLMQGAVPGGGSELRQTVKARIEALGPDGLLSELEALSRRAGGTIGHRPLGSREGAYARPEPGSTPLRARVSSRPRLETIGLHSFSSMIRGAHAEAREDEALDRDAGLDRGPDRGSIEPTEPPVDEPIALADFPAGAVIGELVHGIFERMDFEREEPEELPRLIREAFAGHGLEEGLEGILEGALARILRAPLLPEGELSLSMLPRGSRLDELEFLLPVGRAPATLGAPADRQGPATPVRIAEVFARHGSTPALRAYADRLRRLGFDEIRGFLRGFIDLVFVHRGRWYLLDYKTNHLGRHREDYLPERLERAMSQGHYYLQYHLYALALHRMLLRRLPSYDPRRDFGGVAYLFVRGISDEPPRGAGVYFDRPSVRMIQALDAVLDGKELA